MAQLCSEQGLTALWFTPQGDLGGRNLDSLQMKPEMEIHDRAAYLTHSSSQQPVPQSRASPKNPSPPQKHTQDIPTTTWCAHTRPHCSVRPSVTQSPSSYALLPPIWLLSPVSFAWCLDDLSSETILQLLLHAIATAIQIGPSALPAWDIWIKIKLIHCSFYCFQTRFLQMLPPFHQEPLYFSFSCRDH